MSAGTGPRTFMPRAASSAITGAITSWSSPPRWPPSPACGFSPQTTILGASSPNRDCRPRCSTCSYQQHDRLRRRAQFSEKLGVSCKFDAGVIDDAFLQRRGHEARETAVKAGLSGKSQPFKQSSGVGRTRPAAGHRLRKRKAQNLQFAAIGKSFADVVGCYLGNDNVDARHLCSRAQQFGIRDHYDIRGMRLRRQRQAYFRTDAGWLARRYDQKFASAHECARDCSGFP